MQLKKIACVIFVAVMMFALATFATAAEVTTLDLVAEVDSSAAISKDPVAVKPGDNLEVKIKILSNPGFNMLQFAINYDADALEYTGFSYGTLIPLVTNADSIISNIRVTPDAANGRIGYLATNDDTEANITATGYVVTLKFAVKADFDGTVDAFTFDDTLKTPAIAVTPATPEHPQGNVVRVDATYVNSGEIKAHNYGAPQNIPGDCVTSEKNVYTCTHASCTEVLEVIVDEADGHDYGDLINEVAPTTDKEGAVAHYQCSVCEKYFDEAKDEIDSIVIPKLPKMITVPGESAWTKGSGLSLTFVSDAKFEDLKSVELNGKALGEGCCTIVKDNDGNTVVTLSPEFLESQADGDYTITIKSENGSCSANFSIVGNGNVVAIVIVVIAVIVIIAGAAAAIVILKKKNII